MADNHLKELVDQLTLEEQVSLLSGQDLWSLNAIERLDIGSLRVTDGPNGARGAKGSGGLLEGAPAASFPVGISIGASWDVDLAEEIGAALADEVMTKGAHVLLAPTVNIHRSVTNGRNFECHSEDAELTAKLACAYIKGLQDKGISATIKHFAGNESEIERTTMSSEVDERSLREVYLRPFEDAVKLADTWGIMTSYNRLNGTFTSEHDWLLEDVLRGDWGYQGIVMSDWYGSHSTAETVNAGLDLEMPGPTRDRGDKLVTAVEAGEVSREVVRKRALTMLRLLDKTGALNSTRPKQELSVDAPEHRALIRKAGSAGAVLLKNEGAILPLKETNGKVAVIGPNAKIAQIMGGGSSQITPHYRVSPWDGLASRLGEEQLIYAQGCTNHRFEPLWTCDIKADYFNNQDFAGDPVHTDVFSSAEVVWGLPIAEGHVTDPNRFSVRMSGTFKAEKSGLHQFGVNSAGYLKLFVDDELVVDAHTDWEIGHTFFEEGCDPVVGEKALVAGLSYAIRLEFVTNENAKLLYAAFRAGIGIGLSDKDILDAVQAASEAETALVFVGRSGEWDTEGSDLQDITLPGRQNELVSAVLKANPRTIVVLQTGGPIEMPWVKDAPAILQAWYPGQECGNAITDVLFGDTEPGGRLSQTFPATWVGNPTGGKGDEVYPGKDGKVLYEEGVFIGYRHYLKTGIKPLFPFGFGLSYTDFDLSDMSVVSNGTKATASVTLTNTGKRAGSTVIQLYVGDVQASVERPMRELKAFKKVSLDAGESQCIELTLSERDFAFFDTANRLWRVEQGEFTVEVGLSSTDIRCCETIQMEAMTMKP
ncbi:glycoside hydrolase family 3 C-terminal domain-containing protein [Pseudovibrio sp. Tun.PSC04-5.I4]|uniref:beta-glucosidase n=1 Tax=Pseudovibrio sp. Tun.PSC04-5.I4 TaxID=1798213 RepID=UPI00088F2BE9|nr:glycoside hydrolase family 3 C-terminal domain-containing protein [Pseudovibrio sp. Tun.PSC04-5.I4]SDQ22486.1 beta-glucosidase [Pseudovibrio sp. Tun.PSC04-5.I4]